jgi:hypothetical protein
MKSIEYSPRELLSGKMRGEMEFLSHHFPLPILLRDGTSHYSLCVSWLVNCCLTKNKDFNYNRSNDNRVITFLSCPFFFLTAITSISVLDTIKTSIKLLEK